MRQLHFLSLFLFQNENLFHLFKYKIPGQYSAEFQNTYSYINVRQVMILSTFLLMIALGVRVTSIFYSDELASMPNLLQYNILNWTQIFSSALFLILSNFALKSKYSKINGRNALVIIFCIFILTVTFTSSYLFSLYNPKNTLTIFLTGVVAVSIFFALELRAIVLISIYIIFLFIAVMMISSMVSIQQKLLNMIMSGVLAFFLYACSRYGYYFKAEQFVKVKQLEEKNAEVEELNHQKNEILGFVAHDLRNPLNNIEALSRIILEEDRYKDNTELQLILTSAKQAKHIINDLIEVVQEEKMPLQLSNTDLADYVKNICTIWQSNANNKRINFSSTETELITAINQPKFTRVLDNLIGNALKFSKPETSIDIEISKNADRGVVSIKDFGIGIPTDLQGMLFDQFSKAGRPGLQGEKSIGLGLHISKHIVEQHSGTLTVNSKENVGTTFIVSIPIIKMANSG